VTYEVEQKFRVEELGSIENELRQLGACPGDVIEQVDCYFAHPGRDFAVSDEALRIRQAGADCFITYKGPKIDTTTKTRREIELPLPRGDDTADRFADLLEALGFTRVAEVRKRRRKARILWRGADIEASLDEVDDVGQFVELELSAPPEEVEAAKHRVADVARRLGLSQNERRSYLELLLESLSP
jgi:adenylate cyclase class 2